MIFYQMMSTSLTWQAPLVRRILLPFRNTWFQSRIVTLPEHLISVPYCDPSGTPDFSPVLGPFRNTCFQSRILLPFRNTWFQSRCVVFGRPLFIFLSLAIVLSVPWFTASNYPFSVFKRFISRQATRSINLSEQRLTTCD
jgi:hypothetical protein